MPEPKLTWRPYYVTPPPRMVQGQMTSLPPELEGFDLVDRPIAGRIYASIRKRSIGGWSYYGTTFSGGHPTLDEAKEVAEAKVRSLKPHPMNRGPEED